MKRRKKDEEGGRMDYLRNFEEFLQFGIFWGKTVGYLGPTKAA
jgi:hypothetical protein